MGHGVPELVLEMNGQTWPLDASRSYTLGRDPQGDLVLDDARVSWRHATIRRGDRGWLIEDLGSTNGTFAAGPAGPADGSGSRHRHPPRQRHRRAPARLHRSGGRGRRCRSERCRTGRRRSGAAARAAAAGPARPHGRRSRPPTSRRRRSRSSNPRSSSRRCTPGRAGSRTLPRRRRAYPRSRAPGSRARPRWGTPPGQVPPQQPGWGAPPQHQQGAVPVPQGQPHPQQSPQQPGQAHLVSRDRAARSPSTSSRSTA